VTQSDWHRERTRIANERCAEAVALRDAGWKLKDIGKKMGVSVERVRQLEMKGRRIAWLQTPEGAAELERQLAEEAAAEAVWAARRASIKRARDAAQDRLKPRRGESRAAYEARLAATAPGVNYDPDIVHAHALQQLWRQFIEPHGAWRRPLVGPYRPLHDWLDWRGSAGVTYRNIPGRLEPEWRVSA
jgi:hypothetical protein